MKNISKLKVNSILLENILNKLPNGKYLFFD